MKHWVLITSILWCSALAASPAWSFDPLPSASPEEREVDGEALDAALDSAQSLGYVRSMAVVRDGYLLEERHWFGPPELLRQSWSVTKSVVSMLIGIAIEQGLIEDGLTARMVDYLPEHLVPDDPAKQDILIWHLLTMTAGFEWNEDDVVDWMNGVDPVGDILSRPLADPPGTVWLYNTAASHLLSVVLTEATGMTTLEYADQVLFGPLGITERSWQLTGGYHAGGHGLHLRTHDLAKLGVLTIDGGSWQGERIVSSYWLNLSTYPLVQLGDMGPLTDLRYGMLWWLDRGSDHDIYMALGHGGQFIFCVPSLKLVVAAHSNTGANDQAASLQIRSILDVIVNEILPTVTDRRRFAATGRDVPELSAVDDMMRDMMQAYSIRNATAAITKDGRLVYARGFSWGEPDVEPIGPTALFRTGSIGKAATSLAIHQLMDRGSLTYDSPPAALLGLQALPGNETDPRLDDVTVDHLLTHTSGMYSEDDIYNVADAVADAVGAGPPPTNEEISSYIVSHPFLFDPETGWDYNNYGYIMLDMMVEHVSEKPYSEYVLDNLFRPVGVGRPRVAHGLESELAPTEVNYDGFEGDPYRPPMENAVAAGGWVMAAPDMARLFSALFDDDNASGLLTPETREQMFDMPFPVCEEVGYGRGWIDESLYFIEDHTVGWLTDLDDGLELRSHTGGGSGVLSVAMWRGDGIGFVMFTNQDPLVQTVDFPEISQWPDHDLWESVGISLEPVGAAPTESWIPVVASSDGVGDSVWRSDVGVLNRSALPNSVRLRLYRPSRFIDRELVLAPHEYRTVEDVMAEFGVTGSNPLRVFSSEPLTVTSRTYNMAPEGTFGQFLGSSTPAAGLDTGDQAVLMQLAENDSFRTNIGLHNGWKRPAEVEIALFDGDSLPVANFTTTVPGETTIRINRPFRIQGGRSDISSGYAVVSVLFGQHVISYASVVDNLTDDPTTIPMKFDPGFSDQWIAAAASSGGVHGSRWRTDLCLLNRSGSAATAEVRYRADDGRADTMVVHLETGEQLTVRDVVAEMDMTGGGSLQIVSDRPILTSSRTYNAGDDGTFGQFLDGAPFAETADTTETVWLSQLQQNGTFRTNIGIVNSGGVQANVTLRLFDGNGQEVGEAALPLTPFERLQLQEPFSGIADRDDIDGGYATVTVMTGAGVIAYGSVIDNATNDPTTVPMMF